MSNEEKQVCEFNESEAAAFWNDQWSKGETGWKGREVGYTTFVEDIRNALEAAGRDGNGANFAQKSVFLPLSGDTPAIKYFFEAGFNVYAAELVRSSIESAMSSLFPDQTFEASDDGSVFKLADATRGNSVQLFVGDVFEIAQTFSSRGLVFDAVYDRGSFIAMHPDLRDRYVAMIKSVFKHRSDAPADMQPIMMLERVVRPEEIRQEGPPFHLPLETAEYFPPSEGYKVTPKFFTATFGPFGLRFDAISC